MSHKLEHLPTRCALYYIKHIFENEFLYSRFIIHMCNNRSLPMYSLSHADRIYDLLIEDLGIVSIERKYPHSSYSEGECK